jgi:putative spermidine/putrescine transport system permease protein
MSQEYKDLKSNGIPLFKAIPAWIYLIVPGLIMIIFFTIIPFMMIGIEAFQVEGLWSLQNFVVLMEGKLYKFVFANTVEIAIQVTILCLIISFPVAIFAAKSTRKVATIIIIAIFATFWISILLRTFAWIVVLSKEGPLNDVLVGLGILKERVYMLHTRPGTLIVMVNVMLPYMALPLVGFAINNVDWDLVDAARSLGAGNMRIFWNVILPSLLPGIVTGTFITFIISLSFYVTPMLVGGPGETMVTEVIDSELYWLRDKGRAGAISIVLLVMVTLILSAGMYFQRSFEKSRQVKIPIEPLEYLRTE